MRCLISLIFRAVCLLQQLHQLGFGYLVQPRMLKAEREKQEKENVDAYRQGKQVFDWINNR